MIPAEFLEMARTYRLLSELEPQQLKKLIPIAEELHYETGHYIFREGDRSLFLHLIVSGEVELQMVSDDGIVPVQTLRPGDAMGWSSLTSDCRTHFQARAVSPVTTVALPGFRVREACNSDPLMGYILMSRLLELVTERLDATRMQLVTREAALARGR